MCLHRVCCDVSLRARIMSLKVGIDGRIGTIDTKLPCIEIELRRSFKSDICSCVDSCIGGFYFHLVIVV